MSIDATARAAGTGVSSPYKNSAAGNTKNLPQRVVVIAQGATTAAANYSNTKTPVTGRSDIGQFGTGSPAWSILDVLFPVNGDGVGTVDVSVCALDDGGSGVVAAGAFACTVGTLLPGAVFRFRIGGVLSDWVVVATGDTPTLLHTKVATAINAKVAMPVIATGGAPSCTLAAKWKGITGNDIVLEVVDMTPGSGVTVAITAMASGAINPTIDAALAELEEDDTTLIINALGEDTTALTALAAFNEGRWSELVNRPVVAFYGSATAPNVTAATATDARPTDRTNAKIVAPGSPTLPWVIAAAAVKQIVKEANNNPATGYTGKTLAEVIPGPKSAQWNYTKRDYAMKRGCGTTRVRDGVVKLADVVTMYHPSGEEPPAYRNVVTIVKLANVGYNYRLVFGAPEWESAPIVQSGQVTRNPKARTPASALADSKQILENLSLDAIITDLAYSLKNQTATINPQNQDRIDLVAPVRISGNSQIVDVTLPFSFYFGG